MINLFVHSHVSNYCLRCPLCHHLLNCR